MKIKTSQTITVADSEARHIAKAMEFVDNLMSEMCKFTITDNGKMINENSKIIVDENDLKRTSKTLYSLLWFLADENYEATTSISFID